MTERSKSRAFLLAALAFASLWGASSALRAEDPDAPIEMKKIERTLPNGAKATFVKIEREPAFATIEKDGETFEFDAFASLESIPEDAREVVREVWND